MHEKNIVVENIDQKYNETEKVYIPRTPELLAAFRHNTGKRILQPYLSAPTEPYSLRLRETEASESRKYDATLKTTGTMTAEGKSRSEYSSPITEERFGYYTNEDVPTVRKTRVSPQDKIDIDFFDDGEAWIESEDPHAWNSFLDQHNFCSDDFIDMTRHVPDNELRAHIAYRHDHGGREAFAPYRPFDTAIALEALLPYVKSRVKLSRHRLPIVRLFGRSGSGKSHYLADIQQQLAAENVPSFSLSTDDYNTGAKNSAHTSEENLDNLERYDVAQAREDIHQLLDGNPIRQYTYDWTTNRLGNERKDTPPKEGVIFVEGIWARHEAFDFADVSIEVDTPLATSLGQRITRDMEHRPKFAQPQQSIGYYLEYAEPEYRDN